MIFSNEKASCNPKKIEQIKKKQKNQNAVGNKSTKKSENPRDASSAILDQNFPSQSPLNSQDDILIPSFIEKTLTIDPAKEFRELLQNMSEYQEDNLQYQDKKTCPPAVTGKKIESYYNRCNFLKGFIDKKEKMKLKVADESPKKAKNELNSPKDRSPDSRKYLYSKDKKEKTTTDQGTPSYAEDKDKSQTKIKKPVENERFEKISALTETKESDTDGYTSDENKGEKPNTQKFKVSRPSEIPLWKNRTKFSRKAKHISLLMENPVKEAESSVSLNCRFKKPCTPIEEASICSEGQSEEKVYAKYKNQRKENPGTSDKSACKKMSLENKLAEKNIGDNVQLNKSIKISQIALMSESPCYELTEKQSETNHKAKFIDLEVVRSASATALTGTGAFFGLETVQSKKRIKRTEEEKLEEFGKKFQIPVFSALVGKNSKKNLSSRLTCKENKQGIKNKSKNDKIEKQLGSGKTFQSSETKKEIQDNEDAVSINKKFPPKGKNLKNKESTKKSASPQEEGKNDKTSLGKERKRQYFTSDESDFETFVQKPNTMDEDFSDKNINKSRELPTPTSPLTPVDKNRQQAGQKAEKKLIRIESLDKTKPEEIKRSDLKVKTSVEKKSKDAKVAKTEKEMPLAGIKLEELCIKGTALSVYLNNSFNNSESSQKIDVDVNVGNKVQVDPVNAFEWLYLNYKKCSEQLYKNVSNICSLDAIQTVDEEKDKNEDIVEITRKKKEEITKSESEKECTEPETNISKKKKKVKSAPNDRRNISSDEELPLPSKETDQNNLNRLPLTKSSTQEIKTERHEVFEEAKGMSLRRRTSEPGSFRGFLWKKVDTEAPRGNKASVSSVASSLKHLNTDELEDFIFWEAVPQAMTACWEMSLYHLKRPWSVLSCAIFKYNRESSTPGLILSNLRRGSDKNIRQSIANEKLTTRTKNSFDIEPSIAQKNIDIKNWLAALNFPTPSSTPFESTNEGDFNSRFNNTDTTGNKSMIPTKQKRSATKSKFTEEAVDKKQDTKKQFKSSRKWDSGERGSLKDLIRRKSGGFVTCEQFLNPDNVSNDANHCCSYSNEASTDAVLEDLGENSLSKAEVTERGEGSSERMNEDEVVEERKSELKTIEVLKEVKASGSGFQKETERKIPPTRVATSTMSAFDICVSPLYRIFKAAILLLGCMIGVLFTLQFMNFDLDSLL